MAEQEGYGGNYGGDGTKPGRHIFYFGILSTMPPSGRRTQTGSLGQDTVWAGTFWRKTMKNQPGTMKNHENQPGTMDIHENQPGTMKNQSGTMTNHEN